MEQDLRSQELTELRSAMAVLSARLEALASQRTCSLATTSDTENPKFDQGFALRAVLAMRNDYAGKA